MTKKDYEAIADILKRAKVHAEPDAQWDFIVLGLITYMQDDNPRFNDQRFLKACKYQHFLKACKFYD